MQVTRVFDSHSLHAVLRCKPGEQQVAELREKAGVRDLPLLITDASYAEGNYIFIRKDGPDWWTEIAGEIKASHELGLADAFAARCRSREEPSSSRHGQSGVRATGKRDQSRLAQEHVPMVPG